jgi:hypothetical protein
MLRSCHRRDGRSGFVQDTVHDVLAEDVPVADVAVTIKVWEPEGTEL